MKRAIRCGPLSVDPQGAFDLAIIFEAIQRVRDTGFLIDVPIDFRRMCSAMTNAGRAAALTPSSSMIDALKDALDDLAQ